MEGRSPGRPFVCRSIRAHQAFIEKGSVHDDDAESHESAPDGVTCGASVTGRRDNREGGGNRTRPDIGDMPGSSSRRGE